MPNNNSMDVKNNKKIEREGIIYATIFVLYFGLVILMFNYSVKFLSETINEALSDPQGVTNGESYGQLNLSAYLLISDKLKLSAQKNETTDSLNQALPELASSPETTSSSVNLFAPETQVNTSSSSIEEIKPTISVMNSTINSGLATKLKLKLEEAGFTVLKAGNTKPAKDISVIYFRETLNPNSKYLLEIQKIVSEDYTFVMFPLGNDFKSDVEIIIGNK